jgi:lysozyme family protein
MTDREQEIITAILKREGWDTYTDRASDRGGPTKWGITLASWRTYRRDPSIQATDVQRITEAQAREYYRFVHIVEPRFDQVRDQTLRELLIDAGVNHGPRHPIKWVQWAAEVKQDGQLGPISLAAINAAAPLELFLWVCSYRIRLYGRLTSSDPELQRARAAGIRTQAENTAGWCNRVAEFLEGAARQIEAIHKAGGKTT